MHGLILFMAPGFLFLSLTANLNAQMIETVKYLLMPNGNS